MYIIYNRKIFFEKQNKYSKIFIFKFQFLEIQIKTIYDETLILILAEQPEGK
jgi:hypothetical protein